MANEEKKKFKDTVVGKLFQPKKKEEAPAAKKSFGDAFKEARKAQGADGEFSWNGKKYNTKYKEEVGLKTSPVPKPRPTKSAEPDPVAKKGQTESAAPSALATTTTSLTGRGNAPGSSGLKPVVTNRRGPSTHPVLKTSKLPTDAKIDAKKPPAPKADAAKDKSGRSQKGRAVRKLPPKINKLDKVPKLEVPETKEAPKDKSGRGQKTRHVRTTVPKVTATKVQKLTDTSDIKDKLKGGALTSALKLVAKRVPFLGALVPDKMGDGTRKTGVEEKQAKYNRDKKKRRPTPDGQKTPGQPEPQPEKQSGFRGPRGETKLEMRKKGYFWNQSDKEWKKTQESEARTGMKSGGRVQSKAHGGRIKTTNKSRGGGAATKGTGFKGSF